MQRSNICRLVNSVWLRKARPDYLRYAQALHNCADTQEAHLLSLLRRNRASLYGRENDFGRIGSVSAFQKQVPITEYNDYSAYIQKIADGESRVLTRDRVLLFEPSSGTSSGEKLIPYTAQLQREFQSGINPWIASLHLGFPEISRGRAYWSISPSQKPDRCAHGVIPVGFDSDWSYLGSLGKLLYSRVAVLPLETADTGDTAAFRNATLAGLLAADDLSLISVWSPSFLRLMLDWYRANKSDVLNLMSSSATGRKRVAFLESLHVDEHEFQNIWPDLKVVSCWTHASSEQEAMRLSELLPHSQIQGKGLISTEALVSFPMSPDRDPVLAICSHFFEFMDTNGRILLAHQLKADQEYSVIVTTGGGLYRYQTGDRILVTAFLESVPTLRFIGRPGLVSDWYGEKLNASHVATAINSALSGLEARFAMMAPDRLNGSHSYTLYLQSDQDPPTDIPQRLDHLLQQNPNYRYCRDLGQLYSARVFRVAEDPVAVFEDASVADGARRGDVKMTVLSKQDGWSQRFTGAYLEQN